MSSNVSANLVAFAAPGRAARSVARPLDLAGLVGADWEALPASLRRRFAPGHPPATYAGRMSFERSAVGALFAWLASPFGAPLSGWQASEIETVVRVHAAGGGVVWERCFGAHHRVRSVKLPGPDGTLLELTDGGLGMVLDVGVEAGALVFTSRGYFLSIGRWRLPIPGLLTPGRCRVAHQAIDDGHFRFTLSMTHPLWGTTFRQSGVFADRPA